MRSILTYWLLAAMGFAVIGAPGARAAEPGAGLRMVSLTDLVEKGPMAAAVAYPSTAGGGPTALGPFVIAAEMNAPPALGTFPLIVISHGTGGSMLGHHGLMTSLARSGFVVAAIEHPRDNFRDDSGFATALQLIGRAHHVVALIDGILAHPTLGPLVDQSRGVGMVGHSAGGYTALLSAGAVPKFDLGRAYAEAVPNDFYMRRAASVVRKPSDLKVVSDPRVRSIALMAPALGYLFDKEALARVQVPVRIYRPAADELLPHPWHAERIAQNLPGSPQYQVIDKAGHFVFLTPCSAELAAMAAVICTDPSGVDRHAIHAQLHVEFADFFRRTLSRKP